METQEKMISMFASLWIVVGGWIVSQNYFKQFFFYNLGLGSFKANDHIGRRKLDKSEITLHNFLNFETVEKISLENLRYRSLAFNRDVDLGTYYYY